MGNKLQVKDLINVGIFTAIYFVVIFAVAMLGYIPVFIPLLSVLVPLIGGIPFMLFLTKVKKFGMVLIMGILIGLFFFITGMGIYTLPIGIVCTLIAEFVLKSGGYENAKKAVLSYGLFSLCIFGNFLPIYIGRDAYYDKLAQGGYGTEYADALMRYMPDWSAPVLAICCFVFGLAGGLLGRKILKKHFERAGIT
ncbi:MAG: MptD family putative ECF transporter S component [Treponema sp.]|jgi:energy-coupling factor transport system substrate-specific component|nr:MptD family putative ECF transporter S component [Treponema sp.]